MIVVTALPDYVSFRAHRWGDPIPKWLSLELDTHPYAYPDIEVGQVVIELALTKLIIVSDYAFNLLFCEADTGIYPDGVEPDAE